MTRQGGAEALQSAIPSWGERFHEEVVRPLNLAGDPEAVASAPADSLPAHMPIVTRILWGRHGLVRDVGLDPEYRSQELRLRHRMLQLHQKAGVVTFTVFTAQMVTGVLLYRNAHREIPKPFEGLKKTHKILGLTTWGLYTATATLSLGAPPARRYSSDFSSIKLHRYLAIIHFTGMMAQPWLGMWAADANSKEAYDHRIAVHRTVGWVTYGALTAAIISFALPI